MYSVCAQFPFLRLAKNDEGEGAEREAERGNKEGKKERKRGGGSWARRAGQPRCNT